jgi:hypothetical protein
MLTDLLRTRVLHPTRGTAILKECLGRGFRQVEEEFLKGIEDDNETKEQEDSLFPPTILDKIKIEEEQDDVTS